VGLKNDDEHDRAEPERRRTDMTDTPMIQRVRELVGPIASDLELDVYDIEQRGATLRVTLDTRPGAPGSIDLEQLSLATRLISRELDHTDPVPGRYTLEVTSPGVERNLRTPAHFQREVGKTINVRLANVEAEQRRIEGLLIAADDRTATIRVDRSTDGIVESVDQVIELAAIDRARTVFVWGPQPKPGKPGGRKAGAAKPRAAAKRASGHADPDEVPRESSPDPVKEPS
jgi:ribosome maturation factor RimP